MADISKIKVGNTTYNVKDANAVKGSGTSGCIAKFNGTNTVTDGPAFGSDTSTYLRNDGTWATPTDRNNMVQQYVLPAPSSSKTFPIITAYSGVTDLNYDSTETNYVRKQLGFEFDPYDKKLFLSYATDRYITVSGREIYFRGGNTRISESSISTGGIYTDNSIYSGGDIETETNLIGNKVTCNSMSVTDISSQYTFSKTSGSWNIFSVTAFRTGNVVQMFLTFSGNGSAVSAGGNGFTGTITNGPLPVTTARAICLAGTAVGYSNIDSSGGVITKPHTASMTLSSSSRLAAMFTFICA